MNVIKKIIERLPDKISYLFISASPGIFRILILLVIGIISNKIQGEIANDLSIISFVTMLTAIGAGTKLLHIIPKGDKSTEDKALATLKSAVIQLSPLILFICLFIPFFDKKIYKAFSSPWAASLLLLTSSIYWIIRHFHLAREDKANLFVIELWLWLGTIAAISYITLTDKISTTNVLLSVSAAYTISIATISIKLALHPQKEKVSIINPAISIGLSNLVSGGLINLAPSICYNLGNLAISGAIGIIINTTSITLTLIRAQLYKKSPRISLALSERSPDLLKICKEAQSKILKTTIITSAAVQPLNLALSSRTSNDIDIYSTLGYSAIITALICIPQLCAVNSIVANFIDRSRSMLALNLIHALITITATYLIHISLNNGTTTFISFLALSSLLFLFRNAAVDRIVSREINLLIPPTRNLHNG